MITTEIYIEGRRLDISQEDDALLTFMIDDIKDFSTRNTTFSKTIILPGTAANNKLFGHIFDARVMNSYTPDEDNVGVNFNAAKSARCVIFNDHIQVFKGVLRLLEIVISNGVVEYECAVFGELGGLIASLGAAKLEDLDFSAYNHTWNAATIESSWNASGTSYYYPLIDYGNVSTGKVDYDIRAFRPALFVREYLDKILTGAGYSFESDLFNTARFKKLIIPNNQKEFKRATYSLINASRASSADVLNSGSGANVTIPMTSYVLYLFTGGPLVFTYSGADPVVANVDISFYGTLVGNFTAYKLALYKNGVEDTRFTKNIAQTNSPNTEYFNWTVVDTVSLANGNTLELRAIATPACTGADNLKLIAGNFKVDSISPVLVDYSPGNTVKVNDTIPKNILQKDFLSSILKLFNLYVYEDLYKTKFIYIKPYVDFFDLNVSGIVDWTYKMDRSRAIKLRPMSELNSRYYSFGFKKDSDYYNELYYNRYGKVYGSYNYDSAYEFANERTDIELIFSPSVLVGYSSVDKVVSVMYKLNAGVEERMDTNIRILQSKKVTGVVAWSIKDGVTVLQSGLTTYGYGGHYNDPDTAANDIQFGVPEELFFKLVTGSPNVTQFNVYWSPYMAEITDKDSKLLIAYFKLDKQDINTLDFSKFRYIDGSYWRLNRIVDWNAKNPDVCIVELLKVIYTTY